MKLHLFENLRTTSATLLLVLFIIALGDSWRVRHAHRRKKTDDTVG